MGQHISIGEFLEQNEEFGFHVPEYVASRAVIAHIQERFTAFRDRFWRTAASDTSPWHTQRERIAQVASAVPAYRELDWNRSEYWRDIPLVDKRELRARREDFVNPRYGKDQVCVRDTSGTSGPPLPIWYSPEFAFEFHLFAESKIAWLAGAWTPELVARSIQSVALVDKKSLNNRVWMCPDHSRGLTIRQLYDERNGDAAAALLRLLDRHQPALLVLKPNILGSIARGAGERRAVAANYLRLVVSSGAPLEPEVRRLAQAVLGAPVYNAYGLTEIGVVASECERQQGLHVYEGDVIAEVLAEDGSLQATGTGELVLSSVANEAMPLLRYRTGDFVDLTREVCTCGRPGLRIRSIAGRAFRNFCLPDGSEFAPTNFNELFKRFPIREFQITQLDRDNFEAEIEPLESSGAGAKPPSGSAEALLAAVREYMEAELRGLAKVKVSVATFSPGDKLLRFRSLP